MFGNGRLFGILGTCRQFKKFVEVPSQGFRNNIVIELPNTYFSNFMSDLAVKIG